MVGLQVKLDAQTLFIRSSTKNVSKTFSSIVDSNVNLYYIKFGNYYFSNIYNFVGSISDILIYNKYVSQSDLDTVYNYVNSISTSSVPSSYSLFNKLKQELKLATKYTAPMFYKNIKNANILS
jgi:hypothetical protein